MSKWVEVNGAMIEESYLEQNIREAKNYSWVAADSPDLEGHVHCMVCNIPIGPKPSKSQTFYRASHASLCSYCYEHFVKSS